MFKLDGAQKEQAVTISFPALKIAADKKAGADGVARFELSTPNLALWSPESPTLNAVEISSGDDQLKDRVGFRSIATSGTDVLLNGHKVFLRGHLHP